MPCRRWQLACLSSLEALQRLPAACRALFSSGRACANSPCNNNGTHRHRQTHHPLTFPEACRRT